MMRAASVSTSPRMMRPMPKTTCGKTCPPAATGITIRYCWYPQTPRPRRGFIPTTLRNRTMPRPRAPLHWQHHPLLIVAKYLLQTLLFLLITNNMQIFAALLTPNIMVEFVCLVGALWLLRRDTDPAWRIHRWYLAVVVGVEF